MDSHNTPSCPFCPFSDEDTGFVAQHIEFCHPDGGATVGASHDFNSPRPSDPVDDDAVQYVDCPHGCGEVVTTSELSTHLDLHLAEGIALDENGVALDGSWGDGGLSSDSNEPSGRSSGHKGGKRAAGHSFAMGNASKQARPRSPSATGEQGGVKRLGVWLWFGPLASELH